MMQYLISKAKLAELAGVSRMAITKATSSGKRLEAAVQGKFVNASHPCVVAYLKEKGVGPAKAPKKAPVVKKPAAKKVAKKAPAKRGRPPKKSKAPVKKKPAKKVPGKKPAVKKVPPKPKPEKKQGAPLSNLEAFVQSLPDDLRDDIRKIQFLPFNEVLNMFGSQMQFKGFADGTKKLEEIYKIQIENKKRSGELVDRALFGLVLDIINSTHVKLLNDGTRNMASRAEPKFKAGCDVEEVANFFQDAISKFIRPMKDEIKRKLEGLNDGL